ncbi:CPBP family intramembrane glutamic endopeptidase [Agaribacter marinus]|uniref:CPBP family intramembrane glutamic endopeptidase n=1 Tax=Agaribacter marinus TaxID=1431249 RepID=UPI0024E173CA|nr:CPBP family intramembrane glutamic endopeptidase [Agaribacter marinus]
MVSRWLELFGLFFISPVIIVLLIQDIDAWLMPMLGFMGVVCLSLLLVDKQFKRFRLWHTQNIKSHLRSSVRFFAPWACLLTLGIYFIFPDYFLALPIQNNSLWLITLLIYPLVSVIPQEIIFRTYFFHRYKNILPSKTGRLLVSSFCFGLAHIVYGNWIAVAVTWVGGLIFGYRYIQTRSTLVVIIEHSMWGSFLFTIGLGAFLLTQPPTS